jgi:hypothetical protein
MKTFKFGILALVLGLFTLTSCEKEELEPDYPTTLSGSETDGGSSTVDTVAFIDSLVTEWTLDGGAYLEGGMGELQFLVSSSGELDSLKFRTDWGADYLVEGGSFEYLGNGKFVFNYEQFRLDSYVEFTDTVIMVQSPDYPDYIDVKWKNFNTLSTKSYFYQYVD